VNRGLVQITVQVQVHMNRSIGSSSCLHCGIHEAFCLRCDRGSSNSIAIEVCCSSIDVVLIILLDLATPCPPRACDTFVRARFEGLCDMSSSIDRFFDFFAVSLASFSCRRCAFASAYASVAFHACAASRTAFRSAFSCASSSRAACRATDSWFRLISASRACSSLVIAR
jgi:hypothetical protein